LFSFLGLLIAARLICPRSVAFDVLETFRDLSMTVASGE
jgi:hypothetical protein